MVDFTQFAFVHTAKGGNTEGWITSMKGIVAIDADTFVSGHGGLETKATLKARLAAVWGTIQATLTDFRYLGPTWKRNCEEERLLGVDISGQMDCPLLRPGAPGRAALLGRLKRAVLETNARFADLLDIPRSAATTCVKPSGNSAPR